MSTEENIKKHSYMVIECCNKYLWPPSFCETIQHTSACSTMYPYRHRLAVTRSCSQSTLRLILYSSLTRVCLHPRIADAEADRTNFFNFFPFLTHSAACRASPHLGHCIPLHSCRQLCSLLMLHSSAACITAVNSLLRYPNHAASL